MMALLFILFAIVVLLVIKGKRREALLLTFINLALTLVMFLTHINAPLNIRM